MTSHEKFCVKNPALAKAAAVPKAPKVPAAAKAAPGAPEAPPPLPPPAEAPAAAKAAPGAPEAPPPLPPPAEAPAAAKAAPGAPEAPPPLPPPAEAPGAVEEHVLVPEVAGEVPHKGRKRRRESVAFKGRVLAELDRVKCRRKVAHLFGICSTQVSRWNKKRALILHRVAKWDPKKARQRKNVRHEGKDPGLRRLDKMVFRKVAISCYFQYKL